MISLCYVLFLAPIFSKPFFLANLSIEWFLITSYSWSEFPSNAPHSITIIIMTIIFFVAQRFQSMYIISKYAHKFINILESTNVCAARIWTCFLFSVMIVFLLYAYDVRHDFYALFTRMRRKQNHSICKTPPLLQWLPPLAT